MAGYIGVKDSWAPISTGYTKVNGEWKQVKSAYAKVNGQWKQIFSPALNTIENFKIKSKTADSVVLEWDPNTTAETYSVFVSKTPQTKYLDPPVFTIQQIKPYQFLSSQNKVTTSGTGTISLNTLSSVVSGSGTSFISQIVVDEILFATIGAIQTYVGRVKSIESNTSLTLYADWTLSSASALSFTIYKKNTKTIATDRETTYGFFVNSLDASNNPGISSPKLSLSTPIKVPDPPVLTVKFKNEVAGTITIAWTKDVRADSYNIYRNKTGSFVLYDNVTPSGGAEETYTPLPDSSGQDYAYYVRAKNSFVSAKPPSDYPATTQFSAPSNSINFVSSPITLGNILLSGSSVDHNSVKLQWTDVANADAYFIQISGGTYGSFSDDVSILTTTAADINRIQYTLNLADETNYTIRIRARGAVGTIYEGLSAYSNSISVTTGRAAVTETRWVTQTDMVYGSTESTRLKTTTRYYDPYYNTTSSNEVLSTYATDKAGVGSTSATTNIAKSATVRTWIPGKPGYYTYVNGGYWEWTGSGRGRRRVWVPTRTRVWVPPTPGRYQTETINYTATQTITRQYIGVFYTPITSSTALPAAARIDRVTFRFSKDTPTLKSINVFIGDTNPNLTYYLSGASISGAGSKSFVSTSYYNYLKQSNVNSVVFTGDGSVANFDNGSLLVEWSLQKVFEITSAIDMSIA